MNLNEMKEWMKQFEIQNFDDFLKKEGISPNDERIPLLKKVWNQSLKSSCTYFCAWEGSDYGAEEALTVPTT